MLIQWKNEYSVGVKEIDKQHQKIIDFINEINEVVTSQGSKDKYAGIIESMAGYANYHLSVEEEYFNKFDYPKKESHMDLHNQYRAKVKNFQEKIKAETDENVAKLAYEVIDFLEDWWIGHINNIDKQYTQFFNEHGLS